MPTTGGEFPPRSNFATTRWTLVRSARLDGDEAARAALAELCESYWGPVYTFVRRRGHDVETARDRTQAFFTRIMETGAFEEVDATRGRFRGWLLGCLKHFLANADDHDRALKRGGGLSPLPLDLDDAEERWGLEVVGGEEDPERAFDRGWALALLETVLSELGQEYAARGMTPLFEALRPRLVPGAEGEPLATVAERLERTEGSLKTAVHRLRRRYGELLRQAIAHTVEEPEEIDEEVGRLFRAVSGESS